MKNKIYITVINEFIGEGGIARNYAFYEYFNKAENNYTIYNLYFNSNFIRAFNLVKLLFILFFIRKKQVFIHLGVFLVIFPPNIFIKYFERLFTYLVNRFDINNKLYIEVNDLFYEQSLDLFNIDNKYIKRFQEIMFSLRNTEYIFASRKMNNFANERYIINKNKTHILLNGAPKLTNISDSNINNVLLANLVNKCIYAGTLNKGRNIEKLIEIFSNNINWNLILIGSNGEWLNDVMLPKNIHYLGSFKESIAHNIVSKCDLCLLPYEDKFYYNLCYPTKVPFYLTANVPILSHELEELYYYNYENIYYYDIDKWDEFFKKNKKIEKSKNFKLDDFYWENIIKELDVIIID